MAIDRAAEARKKARAKRLARREKSKGGVGRFLKGVVKPVKKVAKDVKSAVKGSEEYQAGKAKKKVAKAKKKEGKSWKRATQRAKKSGGPSMNTLIKARGMHKKGSDEYNKIQNQINKNMGSRVRHTKVTAKSPSVESNFPSTKVKEKMGEKKQEGGMVEKYEGGGKVEVGNPYGWPTRDARDGGQK